MSGRAKRLGRQTVVLTPPVERDKFGDPIPGTGTPRTVLFCAVYQEDTKEVGEGGTVMQRLVALLPLAQEEVDSDSRVTYRGEDFAISGRPHTHVFLDGSDAGTEITLTDWTG